MRHCLLALASAIPSGLMEVDQQPSTSQAAPAAHELPTLHLDVLDTVKQAQSLHGLKHSDYQRYRQAHRGTIQAKGHTITRLPSLTGCLGPC